MPRKKVKLVLNVECTIGDGVCSAGHVLIAGEMPEQFSFDEVSALIRKGLADVVIGDSDPAEKKKTKRTIKKDDAQD